MDWFSTPPYRTFDVVIIGGGVIGSAVAYRLSSYQRLRVAVLEQEATLGSHASGRASGILHSGIHLPAGSLQAALCLSGASDLHGYCHERAIPHHRRGKLIAALDEEEVTQLRVFADAARRRGLDGITWLSRSDVRRFEPNVQATEALYSPHEVVVPPRTVVEHLACDARSRGVEILKGVRVLQVEEDDQMVTLHTTNGRFRAGFLVNAAGLCATGLAHQCSVAGDIHVLPLKGVYYSAPSATVHGVVHPVPDPEFPFLKVHAERLADGRVRIGPRATSMAKAFLDRPVLWSLVLNRRWWTMALTEGPAVASRQAYVRRVQRLLPSLRSGDLIPQQAALRAQAVSRGKLVSDFVIASGRLSVHLLNIGSPGFTCSLQLADRVVSRLRP